MKLTLKICFALILITCQVPALLAQGTATITIDKEALINNTPAISAGSLHNWTVPGGNLTGNSFVAKAAGMKMTNDKDVTKSFDIGRITLKRIYTYNSKADGIKDVGTLSVGDLYLLRSNTTFTDRPKDDVAFELNGEYLRDLNPDGNHDLPTKPVNTEPLIDKYLKEHPKANPVYGPSIKGKTDFTVFYSIADLSANAWVTGDYSQKVNFTAVPKPGAGGESVISPPSDQLKVHVPSFIAAVETTPLNFSMNINDLKYYRDAVYPSQGPATISYCHTVPFSIWINEKIALGNNDLTGQFKLSKAMPGVKIPEKLEQNNQLSKSNGDGPFSPSTVLKGNITAFSFMPFMDNSPARMMNFINMGTYTATIEIKAIGPDGTAASRTINETITVADMGELASAQTTVTLSLKTGNDYSAGIKSDGTDYLTISKTSPYDLYVRVKDDNLKMESGSAYIPAGLLSVNIFNPGTDIVTHTVAALSTTPQQLISGGQPALDQKVYLQYAIKPENSTKLINNNFKSGKYTTDVIYTFAAK